MPRSCCPPASFWEGMGSCLAAVPRGEQKVCRYREVESVDAGAAVGSAVCTQWLLGAAALPPDKRLRESMGQDPMRLVSYQGARIG